MVQIGRHVINGYHSDYDYQNPGQTIRDVVEARSLRFMYRTNYPPPKIHFISKYNDSHWQLNKIKSGMIIGFDTEWNMPKGHRTKPSNVKLIQLATLQHIYLIRVYSHNSFPWELRRILYDESIIKVGVGIKGDATRIFNQYDHPVNGIMELSYMAKNLDSGLPRNNQMVSLAALCERYLDKTLPKGLASSNWNRSWLTDEQIQYAANDPYCTLEIVYHLIIHKAMRGRIPDEYIDDPEQSPLGQQVIEDAVDRTQNAGQGRRLSIDS